jgi:hypothetical protein|tara:strand:- start:28117 stop:29925 length:1809 start_codon:yes stop_codon:yes gene_type:complete
MASNNRPLVANLDFDDIKEDIINHYKANSTFKDYNFTGSALNTIVDMLAYNTHLNALTANFAINEMFLDTSQRRENVLSLAKSLNYQPTSTTASNVTLTLAIPRDGSEASFTIPAGSLAIATSGNTTFNFFTIQDYIVQYNTGDTTKNIDVIFYEGVQLTQRFIHSNSTISFPTFDILNTGVDTQTIVVTVNGIKYTKITPENEGVVLTNAASLIYFVEETYNLKHRIRFGNGVIGKGLVQGDEIIITYLTTKGVIANGINAFTVSISGKSGASIATVQTSAGGADIESIRSIKDNAPHWFQSQFRAVTTNDYEVIVKKNYPDIQAINVYGGEEVGKPGKVFLSIKPITGDKLSDAAKLNIKNNILNKFNIVTVKPEIVDPNFIELILNTVVIYDNAKLTTNTDAVKTKIVALYKTFNTDRLGEFKKNFFEQNLAEEIKLLDQSILSINTRTSLRYDINVVNSILGDYQIQFNNPLYHPFNGYNTDKGGIISTNKFYRIGKTFTSGFDDDGKGNIRLFDLLDGVKVYNNNKAGTVDYNSGEINIQDFDPSDGKLQFTAVPDSFDVQSANQYILRISLDSSIINLIEKDNKDLINLLNKSRSV